MKIYNWKLKLFSTAVALTGAFAWGVASAQTISGTPHDLSTGNATTGQVCVFCHTPHGSDTSAAVPLWNKTLDATPATTYTTYNSLAASATSSLDGTVTDVGSVSLACLSCHDGSQAMDSVLNEPGSGADSAYVPGTTKMTGIANLTTDLTNDHPVGVQYAGGGVTTTVFTGADADFKPTATPLNLNGTDVWWVDTEGTPNGTREKTDMQLYTRDIGGGDEPFVECASCHDPHTNEFGTFLRITNDGSGVCLACHTK